MMVRKKNTTGNLECDEELFFNKLVGQLLKIDISCYDRVIKNVCDVIVDNMPGIIFCSYLTYSAEKEVISYKEIKAGSYGEKSCDRSCLIELIEDVISFEADKSIAGKLINSEEKVLKIEDVMKHDSFRSIRLGEALKLRRALFLKIKNLGTGLISGIVVIYPQDKSPVYEMDYDRCNIFVSLLENIVTNASRVRMHKYLDKILEVAVWVNKNINIFFDKIRDLIVDGISASACSIFVVDPFNDLIRLKTTTGVKPGPKSQYVNGGDWALENVYYRIGEGFTGKVVENNEIEIVNDFNLKQSKWIEKKQTKNSLFMPIKSVDGKKAIGVIRCSTKPNKLLYSQVESFNYEDIKIVNYVSKLISVFLELHFYQRSQKLMISRVPHELTSSLRSIYNACEVLEVNDPKKDGYKDVFNQKIDSIKGEAELSMMTVYGLSLFEIDINEYEFVLSNISEDVIKRIGDMVESISKKEKRVCVTYEPFVEIPNLYIDQKKIVLVFYNLLRNAVKYTLDPERGCGKCGILITNGRDEKRKSYTVSVSNFGIGISESKKEDIFLPGIRSIEAMRINPVGKGLGLALAKNIMRVHGGDIEVTNLKDPTVFTLYFPYKLASQTPKGGKK